MASNIFDLLVAEYEVQDVKVAVNNMNGTFGTLVDVPSANLFVTNYVVENIEGTGDAQITVGASSIRKIEVSLRNVSVPYRANAIMAGFAVQSSGGTRMSVKVGVSKRMPVFAICGRALSADTTGGALIFIPALKVTESFEWRFEYNGLSSQEIRMSGYGDPVLLDDDGLPLLLHAQKYASSLPQIVMPLPA